MRILPRIVEGKFREQMPIKMACAKRMMSAIQGNRDTDGVEGINSYGFSLQTINPI